VLVEVEEFYYNINLTVFSVYQNKNFYIDPLFPESTPPPTSVYVYSPRGSLVILRIENIPGNHPSTHSG
jgi:hypothetical protein